MPKGVYVHRSYKRTPDVCRVCAAVLVADENWKKSYEAKLCTEHYRLRARAKARRYYHADDERKARIIAKACAQQRVLRSEMIEAYGSQCVCCGEPIAEFLNIDHIGGRGVGAEHRKTVAPGSRIVQWLKQRGWPKEGFQLLCWNCNCASGMYGHCPHQNRSRETSFPWAA